MVCSSTSRSKGFARKAVCTGSGGSRTALIRMAGGPAAPPGPRRCPSKASPRSRGSYTSARNRSGGTSVARASVSDPS